MLCFPAAPQQGDHALRIEVADSGEQHLRVVNLKAPQRAPVLRNISGETTISIGRARANSVYLNDQSVSAMHAELYRDAFGAARGGHEGWMLRDLGSSNGTCLRLSPERCAHHLHDLPLAAANAVAKRRMLPAYPGCRG